MLQFSSSPSENVHYNLPILKKVSTRSLYPWLISKTHFRNTTFVPPWRTVQSMASLSKKERINCFEYFLGSWFKSRPSQKHFWVLFKRYFQISFWRFWISMLSSFMLWLYFDLNYSDHTLFKQKSIQISKYCFLIGCHSKTDWFLPGLPRQARPPRPRSCLDFEK